MVVFNTSSPFGSQTRTRVLVALWLVGSSYARELARVLDIPLFAVQKGLRSLERDGLVAGRAVGRTREFQINPAYFARAELMGYLQRLAEPDRDLARRIERLRRRPRRSGKPL